MFSQFTRRLQDSLEAVEHIAVSGVSPVAGSTPHRTGSAETGKQTSASSHGHSSDNSCGASSTSLAEDSLSGFRRSMSSQRPASPSPPTHVNAPPRTTGSNKEPEAVRRTLTLQERLQASLVSKSSTRASPPITSPLAEAREAQDFARADQSQETDPLQVPLPTSPPPEVDSPTPIAPVAPIPVPADPLTPSLAAAELHSPCPRPHSQLQSIIPLSSLAEYPTSSSPTQWSTGNTSDQLYGASFQADGMAPKPSDIVESVPSEGGEISTEPVESMVALLESSDQIQTELHDGTSSNLTDDRLQVVEKRFSDMASSFKRLQAERHAADKLLKSFSPSLAISDLTGLAAFLANLMSAADDAAADIRELTEKLRIQAERMEELRDTHSLEGISRSEQVDLLQRQQKEAEALLAASQSAAAGSIAELETLRKKGRDDLAAVQGELEKARKMIKEEEEKRVKAISLLKTVRTKLVNTEKELEEANQERTRLKEDGIKLRDKEKSERERLEAEIQKLKDEKAKESARLWTQFEADLANQRLKMEKEMSAKQSQLELQIINLKATHDQELSAQDVKISQLEASNKSLTVERNSLFDQLQTRQAEVESSQSHQESLENQATELRHQLREANDKIHTLSDELVELQRRHDATGLGSPSTSFANNLQIVSDIERRYENKISDLRQRMDILERERSEAEEEWSRNLTERSREIDRLRTDLSIRDSAKNEEVGQAVAKEQVIAMLKQEISLLTDEKLLALNDAKSANAAAEQAREAENFSQMEQNHLSQRVTALEKEAEELRIREISLRAGNKTLREELRKVQSSAALLERGRNPGIGYWANKSRSNLNGQDINEDRPGSPHPSSPAHSVFSDTDSPRTKLSEEAVNLEYLRNIIMQFLEHKEMRPHLVRVMSVILQFTPSETRRLISKV